MYHRESLDRSNTSSLGNNEILTSAEEALRMLCKQLLKSRFFRGYYEERRYVEMVHAYRDVIILQASERELEKVLLDIRKKLHIFYQYKPKMWIGITNGNLHLGSTRKPNKLETCIWAELDDMAFGQYWFSVKSIRFRECEIVIKLKMVRPLSEDIDASPSHRQFAKRTSPHITPAISDKAFSEEIHPKPAYEQQVNLNDFVNIVQQWGTCVKHSVYDFMSNDVNKDNIVGVLKFIGLLIVSLISGMLVATKFLGVFIIRFMFEFSRFTTVMTPIILKLIEVINKIVGGFYLLVAMIWKDAVGKPNMVLKPKNHARQVPQYQAITFEKSLNSCIDPNMRQSHRLQPQFKQPRFPEFERSF